MGAIGVRRVYEDLQKQGHHLVELERGSMGFKIWKSIKIKRIRVPDLLCITCGRRIESRAKTKLELSMSHSTSDRERSWDYNLADDDVVAFVVCHRNGSRPIDWKAEELVQYVPVSELRKAEQEGLTIITRPKGAEEGFEARIIWPAIVAKASGTIESIDNDSIRYRRDHDKKIITSKLTKQGLKLKPLWTLEEQCAAHQILAANVKVTRELPCQSQSIEYIGRLTSSALHERYAAVKALAAAEPNKQIILALRERLKDRTEHIYIRLEAAANLARWGVEEGWEFIDETLRSKYHQERLEAVIILGEIPNEKAYERLCQVVKDKEQPSEIRAGAAWSLGEFRSPDALNVLVPCFDDTDDSIRFEAARSLARLAENAYSHIVEQFRTTTPERRPGIAWALSRIARSDIVDLLRNRKNDDDIRHWLSYIIGLRGQQTFIERIEDLRNVDSEVYFTVTVLWKIMSSWIFDLEEYG